MGGGLQGVRVCFTRLIRPETANSKENVVTFRTDMEAVCHGGGRDCEYLRRPVSRLSLSGQELFFLAMMFSTFFFFAKSYCTQRHSVLLEGYAYKHVALKKRTASRLNLPQQSL